MLVPRTDSIIAADSAAYYAQKKDVFYTRDTIQHYGKPEIGPEQLRLLNNIKSILAAHHTNYRIVISPLYDQLKLDPADRAALEQIFGKEYVFDFSGINNITADKHNYYEISHYRIPACTYILDRIYDGSVR